LHYTDFPENFATSPKLPRDKSPTYSCLSSVCVYCLSNAMHGHTINLPVCVCLCVRHTFLPTNLQVRPLNGFLQLIAEQTRIYAKMCLLGVSMMNKHIQGSKVPQNSHFRDLNKHFKPNVKNSNSYIFRSVYQIDMKFDI